MIQKDQSSSLTRMTKRMREGRAAQAISIHLCVCVCVCGYVFNESMRVPVCVCVCVCVRGRLSVSCFVCFYLFQSNVL